MKNNTEQQQKQKFVQTEGKGDFIPTASFQT